MYIATMMHVITLLASPSCATLKHTKTQTRYVWTHICFVCLRLNDLCSTMWYITCVLCVGVDLPAFFHCITCTPIWYQLHAGWGFRFSYTTIAELKKNLWSFRTHCVWASNHNTLSTCAPLVISIHTHTNKMCEYEWISRMNGVEKKHTHRTMGEKSSWGIHQICITH